MSEKWVNIFFKTSVQFIHLDPDPKPLRTIPKRSRSGHWTWYLKMSERIAILFLRLPLSLPTFPQTVHLWVFGPPSGTFSMNLYRPFTSSKKRKWENRSEESDTYTSLRQIDKCHLLIREINSPKDMIINIFIIYLPRVLCLSVCVCHNLLRNALLFF